MDDLNKYFNKQMKNPLFREEHEKTRTEFEIMKAIINARIEKNMTQKDLAEKTGLRQSNISRIERGACIPNIATLQTIAKGLDKELHIEFR